jgi:hypothetical protein
MFIEIIINKQHRNHGDKKVVQSRKGEDAAGTKDIMSDNNGRKKSPAKRNSSSSMTGRGGKQRKKEDRVVDSSSSSGEYSESSDGTPG